MKYRILGATGMSVSEFALGTMMFGTMGNSDHEESIRMIHTAMDAGINFIDTADVYSKGESEEIVGKALKGKRDKVLLATKFGLPMAHDANQSGGARRWIIRAVEDSLRRLGTDYIDLYQMHRPDPNTDIGETLSALSDLIRSGKVRAIGSSTFPAEQIVEAQWVADKHNHHRFLTEQPRYSILNRTNESAVLPSTQRYRMGVLSYGPLSSGWLSGQMDPTTGNRASLQKRAFDLSVPGNQLKLAAVQQLTQLATEVEIPLAHMATAFVLSHPAITSVIIGPRTPEQLKNLLAGADVVLNEDTLDRIDKIVPPGTDLNEADNTFLINPAIDDKRLRRR
ncbi:aldo/keto reductase [Paenibacillus sp. CGMCC 1.16610]|uniref:Aldo/keto reductase n=1 Tax=Paenibacillus anseongense TaxID=2682845 RepID=A0ABW9UH19_9BACL|nr:MULTISPECIES: aldo/keto reductase [Paenibacillus]MBA2939832.1 aldo/keto reductase [Paenibacillus sp. CGMCC 1.16610]MVQ39492.1 aldo/keto reductase [Paenibacillus anseongense]